MAASRSELVDAIRIQARVCHAFQSPLNGCLLEVLAEDAVAGGEWVVDLAEIDEDPLAGNVPVRLMGAFHRYVLDHVETPLARFYPSAGGRFDIGVDREPLAQCIRDLLLEHVVILPEFVAHAPQTNEVARASGLAAGFLEAVSRFKLPLSVLEIGASAGLNQLFDRYRHSFESGEGIASWGPGDSPVQLKPEWQGPVPRVGADLCVAQRASCDVAPLDVRDDSVRRRLEAYVWTDQPERLARLRGAILLGHESEVLPDAAGAADWLGEQLPERTEGQLTVLFHSIMWQYMPEAEQEEVTRLIESEGARARAEKPLAWLRLEPPSPLELPEIRLRVWPDGDEQLIGHAHPHGHVYQWRGWQA